MAFEEALLQPVSFYRDNEVEVRFATRVTAVDLGSKAYGGPIIAGGRVIVGTNNQKPRDPKDRDKNGLVVHLAAFSSELPAGWGVRSGRDSAVVGGFAAAAASAT